MTCTALYASSCLQVTFIRMSHRYAKPNISKPDLISAPSSHVPSMVDDMLSPTYLLSPDTPAEYLLGLHSQRIWSVRLFIIPGLCPPSFLPIICSWININKVLGLNITFMFFCVLFYICQFFGSHIFLLCNKKVLKTSIIKGLKYKKDEWLNSAMVRISRYLLTSNNT